MSCAVFEIPESRKGIITGEVRWAVPVEWVTSGYNLFELEWPARRTTEILDIKLQADSLRQFIKCCPERPASIDREDVSFTIRTLPDQAQICTVDADVVEPKSLWLGFGTRLGMYSAMTNSTIHDSLTIDSVGPAVRPAQIDATESFELIAYRGLSVCPLGCRSKSQFLCESSRSAHFSQ